jgi:hypothetical protein
MAGRAITKEEKVWESLCWPKAGDSPKTADVAKACKCSKAMVRRMRDRIEQRIAWHNVMWSGPPVVYETDFGVNLKEGEEIVWQVGDVVEIGGDAHVIQHVTERS